MRNTERGTGRVERFRRDRRSGRWMGTPPRPASALLSSVMSSWGGSRVLFHQDMWGRKIISICRGRICVAVVSVWWRGCRWVGSLMLKVKLEASEPSYLTFPVKAVFQCQSCQVSMNLFFFLLSAVFPFFMFVCHGSSLLIPLFLFPLLQSTREQSPSIDLTATWQAGRAQIMKLIVDFDFASSSVFLQTLNISQWAEGSVYIWLSIIVY